MISCNATSYSKTTNQYYMQVWWHIFNISCFYESIALVLMGMDFNAISSLSYNSITFDTYMTLPKLLKFIFIQTWFWQGLHHCWNVDLEFIEWIINNSWPIIQCQQTFHLMAILSTQTVTNSFLSTRFSYNGFKLGHKYTKSFIFLKTFLKIPYLTINFRF
jgi:hypothetical protein